MKTIRAGTRVESGHYLSLRTWSIQPVERAGSPLVGRAGERFVASPAIAAVALAPMLGALFVVFLPVIGFWLTAVAASRPAKRLVNRIATAFAATVEPGWEPGLAHLTGKRGQVEVAVARVVEDPLDALERDIAALRSARRSNR